MSEISKLSQPEAESILLAKLEWEQIFDAVAEMIFIVDKDHTVIRANRAMAEHCGLDLTEVVGRKCHELIQATDCNPGNCIHSRVIESKKPETLEFKLKNRDEIFEVTISPLLNSAGQVSANVFVARDVSKQRKTELALQESENLFSVFMDHLPLLVLIKDSNGKILFANEYFKDLHGVAEITGLSADKLVAPEMAAKIARDDQEVLAQGLGLYHDVIKGDDGNEIILETYKFPIPRVDGTTLLGAICVDVTEKKRHEKLLEEQRQRLIELNKTLNANVTEVITELRQKDAIIIQESRLTAMGEMISNIAHQWRQPLNNIGLIVQSLQLAFKANDLSPEELDQDISDVMKVLQQISVTIDDFRNFFSSETETSSFIVNDIISRALFFAEPSLRSKGIKVQIDEEPNITATGYPNEYAQAFLNIILNARDALLDHEQVNPVVFIRIFEKHGRSVVTVRDNGGGIPEHVLPKIFDPYFSTKLEGKGSGIGLYMAKMIVEKHMQGRLTARNWGDCAEFMIEV